MYRKSIFKRQSSNLSQSKNKHNASKDQFQQNSPQQVGQKCMRQHRAYSVNRKRIPIFSQQFYEKNQIKNQSKDQVYQRKQKNGRVRQNRQNVDLTYHVQEKTNYGFFGNYKANKQCSDRQSIKSKQRGLHGIMSPYELAQLIKRKRTQDFNKRFFSIKH